MFLIDYLLVYSSAYPLHDYLLRAFREPLAELPDTDLVPRFSKSLSLDATDSMRWRIVDFSFSTANTPHNADDRGIK